MDRAVEEDATGVKLSQPPQCHGDIQGRKSLGALFHGEQNDLLGFLLETKGKMSHKVLLFTMKKAKALADCQDKNQKNPQNGRKIFHAQRRLLAALFRLSAEKRFRMEHGRVTDSAEHSGDF